MTFKPCLFAMTSMAFTSQGIPYTCVASIALVFSVMAASIFAASIVKVLLSISTNIGVHCSHTMEEVVATYEKGVVIISHVSSSAFMAICMAIVPLFTKKKCFTSR